MLIGGLGESPVIIYYNLALDGIQIIWDRRFYIINSKKQEMSNSSYEIQVREESENHRNYHRTLPEEKNNLIRQVLEQGLSISKAAKKLKINNSTAKVIIRKHKEFIRKQKKQQGDLEASIENKCNSPGLTTIYPQPQTFEMPYFIFFQPLEGASLALPFFNGFSLNYSPLQKKQQ